MTSLATLGAVGALRILCGLFLIPHLIGDLLNPKQASKIYDDAGLGHARAFFSLSVCADAILSVCLVAGFLPRWTASATALYLGIAAAVVWKVERRWLWNLKGIEFLVFWACCCILIAVRG